MIKHQPKRARAALRGGACARTHLPLAPLQDGVDVIVCDLALLGGEDVRGAVPDDREHLVFAQLVGARIHKSPCCDEETAIMTGWDLIPFEIKFKTNFTIFQNCPCCATLLEPIIVSRSENNLKRIVIYSQ